MGKVGCSFSHLWRLPESPSTNAREAGKHDVVLSEVGAVSAEEGVSSEGSQEGSATASPLPLSPRGVRGKTGRIAGLLNFFLFSECTELI